MSKNNNQTIVIKQTLELIRVILNQNYFQYNDKYLKPTKGLAVGSPISRTLAEIYLRLFEEHQTLDGEWRNIILKKICIHHNHI
jgi:hypothetical protein